jgi:hypothetical protein
MVLFLLTIAKDYGCYRNLVCNKYLFTFLIGTLLFCSSQANLFATNLPSGFAESLVTAGLNNPTSMAFAPDGRIFITVQGFYGAASLQHRNRLFQKASFIYNKSPISLICLVPSRSGK